jgi:UDP-3-O-[3-hydroxymyristoyl] glucosamine N-acyltransferase
MTNEYIPFLETLAYKEISIYLDRTGINYTSTVDNFKEYKGLSDGRAAETATICFVDREPTAEVIESLAGVLIFTTEELQNHFKHSDLVVSNDPRALFIKLIEIFEKEKLCSPFTSEIKEQAPTIHPEAVIDDKAVLEEGVSVGKSSIVSAGVVLKRGTSIGENCIVRENCTIGCNGIALYKTSYGEILRFPHLAGVHIGNNIELGAGVVVVRGTLTNTVIENDTVIGNLCNIGHGVKIGKKVWMSVGSLIGGNCTIGANATLGLGVRLRDNLTIGENVSIGMGSVVTKNIPDDISVFGNPAKKLRSLITGPKR